MDLEDLAYFNPWWRTGSLPGRLEIPTRRNLYHELVQQLPTRQILAIVGMRRTGKTTLMYQLIESLLESGVPSGSIVFFSFDRNTASIREVIDCYRSFNPGFEEGDRTFFFLDEIQKLHGWEDQLKMVYDQNFPMKFIISGSSGLTVHRRSRESLAGRVYSRQLHPLSFREYLAIRGIPVPPFDDLASFHSKVLLAKSVYVAELQRYMRYGGLIEGMEMDDHRYSEFIQSVVMDKILFQDIPGMFNSGEPAVLRELIRILAERPGQLINYESLASDLKRSRQTVSNYVYFLESSYVLRILYNYSSNFITSAKKAKKVYLSHPSLVQPICNRSIDPVLEGMLMENLIVSETGCGFFHRSPSGHEIDCILRRGPSIIPVEVKYQERISRADVRFLKRFIQENELPLGVVVTKDLFSREEGITCIPAYLFLLVPGEHLERALGGGTGGT